jgi:hypothetical protein
MNNFQTFSEFLDYIEKNYDEEQNIIIENFMAYYINKYRDKYNDEDLYKSDLKDDVTGDLNKLSLIGFVFEKNITGNTTLDNVQRVTLSYKNYNYYPNTIAVNINQPVEITLDDSIRGCFRSFTIKDFERDSRFDPEDTDPHIGHVVPRSEKEYTIRGLNLCILTRVGNIATGDKELVIKNT